MRPAIARMALAASALIATTGADARFAPLEGRSYREIVTQVRDDGSGIERFVVERTVAFARRGDRWVATVTFGPTQPSTTSGAAALLQRATAALAGTTIRYRLNTEGAIVEIEDAASQWKRFVATVAAMGGSDAARSKDAAAIAGALGGLPEDQRRDILIEAIAGILAATEAEHGAQPITKTTTPARSALGVQTDIAGTTAATETASAIRIVTEGEGPLAIGGVPSGHIRIRRSREIDKTTGLLREAHEETVTDAVIGGKPAHQSITNTTTLTLVVS